jgi:hypothetical protein
MRADKHSSMLYQRRSAIAKYGNVNINQVYISQKSGNTRYIVANQALKWQHNWQQSGNTSYIVDYQVFTLQNISTRNGKLARPP